jgi:hypothetical protein
LRKPGKSIVLIVIILDLIPKKLNNLFNERKNKMNKKIERPEIVEDDHLAYLDALRKSGLVNMFGASKHLTKEFGIMISEARIILTYWMESFSERHGE